MDQREVLFGNRITRLRREVAALESDITHLASLHSYTAAMDSYDLQATVRDLESAAAAAHDIMTKLKAIERTRT